MRGTLEAIHRRPLSRLTILAVAGLIGVMAPTATPAWAAPAHRGIAPSPHLVPSSRRIAHRAPGAAHPSASVVTDPFAATAPRGTRLRQQLPTANPVITAAWTALGANPATNEVSLCNPPPAPSKCGSYGNASGRVTSLAVDPTNGQVVYAGSAGGGVLKTTNGGGSWAALTDTQASLAIGALAISPDGQTIYAGTGEDNNSESQVGQGILISTNAGVTWTLSGQSPFAGHRIGSIAIDRGTPQHVLVASDIGLWETGNGGSTWTPDFSSYQSQITALGTSMPSGAVRDIYQDPDNVNTWWLSVTDGCSTEAGDVLTTTNNGVVWTRSTPAALSQNVSRIALGVGHGGVAYLSAAGCNGNLVDLEKTITGAATWTQLYSAQEYAPGNPPTQYTITVSRPGLFNYFNFSGGNFGQGDYDNVVGIDPANTGHAMFGGVTALSTSDGGSTFIDAGREYVQDQGIIHPDFHALQFSSHDHLYAGNDAGVYKTSNLGGVGQGGDWMNLNSNLDTIQYYGGTALDASRVLGGTQDNGSQGSFSGTGPLPQSTQYLDGDGTYTAIDPHSTSTSVWAAYPGLGIFKGSSTGPLSSFVVASPCSQAGQPACADSTDFVAPFLLDSSNNNQRLIAGTNRVWYSATGGVPAGPAGWTPISNPMVNPSFSNIDRLTVLAMTPSGVTGEIMTGSRGGQVWRSRQTPGSVPTASSNDWVDVTANLPAFPGYNTSSGPTGVQPNAWITGIVVNPSNLNEAWVTIGGLHVAHVFHTSNLQTNPPTWASIDGTGTTNVPDESADAVAFDSTSGNLYVGTETGILRCAASACAGSTAAATASWSVLGNLPNAKVNALTFTKDNELVAWTHGRGAWALLASSPALFVSPATISVSCARGAITTPPQPITVTNKGGGTLNWTVTNNANPVVTAAPVGGAPLPLATGTSQTVNVTATCPTSAGVYPASLVFSSNGGSPRVQVNVVATYKGQYTPLPPARILDTRNNIGHNGALTAGVPVAVPVAGWGGVPAMNSTTPPSAAVINVTATNTRGAPSSYLTVYPGPTQPTASNLNWSQGETVANLVEAALAPDGTVTIKSPAGSVDVIFDVQGWVSTPGAGPVNATAGLYNPLLPARIMDTRIATGAPQARMNAGQTLPLQVTGHGGVPAGASAVVLNLTETDASGAPGDYLTVYPSDAAQPTASNLNFTAGQTRANRVVVKLGAGGGLKIFNAAGNVNVIVDVGGWFTNGTTLTTGAQFTGVDPSRILDTRNGIGGYTTALGPGTTYTPVIAGLGGVPSMDSTVPPSAVVMNVTSSGSTAASFLTIYPSDAQLPVISDLNWPVGANIPNLVVVKLSPEGRVNLFSPVGSTDVIADVVGWYN